MNICEHCFQTSPCGCMNPQPTPFGQGNRPNPIRRLWRVILSFFRHHLLAVVAAFSVSLFSANAYPPSGGEFDSLVAPREATFVRACYLTTGASLRGDETVSSILTVLYIGRWSRLTQTQQIGLFQIIANVKRRWQEGRKNAR